MTIRVAPGRLGDAEPRRGDVDLHTMLVADRRRHYSTNSSLGINFAERSSYDRR